MRKPVRRSALALLALGAGALSYPLRADYIQAPGVGNEAQGAGMVLTFLDGDPRPEMILMAYDNPDGPNSFRYRIGWNLDPNGNAVSWSDYTEVPGVDDEAQGAGAAIANLDGNARPELVVMAYHGGDGPKNFRYKIGWNLDLNGQAATWSPDFVEVPGVADEVQGAAIKIVQLDDNARPEMILLGYGSPPGQNTFRYRIGSNLDERGIAASWSEPIAISGVGDEGQGVGLDVFNFDRDPRPDLILMAYDNPGGPNSFRYRTGSNLNASGIASAWVPLRQNEGVGNEGAGAGVEIVNLFGGPNMVLMAYDDPSGGNSFRYRILQFVNGPRGAQLEMDKLASVDWPPASAVRSSVTYSLASVYSPVGIHIAPLQDEGSVADLHPGVGYTDAELDSFRMAHMNKPPTSPLTWHTYGAFLTQHVDRGTTGVMFDGGQRRAFAVFANVIGSGAPYLRTTCHELGHAFNLLHNDGDAWGAAGPVAGQGRTIMNQTRVLAADWSFGWSASDLEHFRHHLENRWRPGSGTPFPGCH